MSLACTAARPLKRCLFTTLSASPLVSRHPNCIHPVQFTTLGCTRSFHWAPTAAASSSPQQRGSSSRRFVRFFSADAAATNSNSNSNSSSSSNSGSSSTTVSFEPHEVSRQLVELAQKYCKEGAEVSASHKFECLQTREERPWDCLDTVEFVLDAEDMYGVVIPDEDADGFESIQDVVDFIVKAGEAQRKGAADEEKKN